MSNNLYYLGIDIGGTSTKYGIVDDNGTLVYKNNTSTLPHDTFDSLFETVWNDIKKQRFTIHSIGIGAPNGNYYSGKIENAPNLKWKGEIDVCRIGKKISEHEVSLTNDANAAAIGEKQFGKAKMMKDFVVITLGTGLGSGFYVNNTLLYGSNGMAGEAGHITIFPGGRLCSCGRKGCLEEYVSAKGIKKTVLEFKHEFHDSVLNQYQEERLNPLLVFEAAQQQDKLALKVFDYTAEILALGLTTIINITAPEAIFLLGGISSAGNQLFIPLQRYMEQYALSIFKNKTLILPSGLEPDTAGILGAAALAKGQHTL